MLEYEVLQEDWIADKPTILVLTFQRYKHLKEVIKALSGASEVSNFNVVFLIQDHKVEILQLCEMSKFKHKSILRISPPINWQTYRKINMNMRVGASFIFDHMKTPWGIFLEDDIKLEKDSLVFFQMVENSFGSNPNYRATNAFSRMPRKIDPDESSHFVRLNYGVGWGWSLNLKNYSIISDYWTGYEKQHWDGFLEPFFRTGFVVNPWQSRCINIGLEGSGSHTGIQLELFNEMQESSPYLMRLFRENQIIEKVDELFEWRDECIQLSGRSSREEHLLYKLQTLYFHSHKNYHLRGRKTLNFPAFFILSKITSYYRAKLNEKSGRSRLR